MSVCVGVPVQVHHRRCGLFLVVALGQDSHPHLAPDAGDVGVEELMGHGFCLSGLAVVWVVLKLHETRDAAAKMLWPQLEHGAEQERKFATNLVLPLLP